MKLIRSWLSLLLVMPSVSFGNALCPAAQSTREIADCLVEQVQRAERRMTEYLTVAKERYKDNAALVLELEASQQAWTTYRKAHCGAVYEKWAGGTMRFISHPTCLLYTTKARTYDIWREFLTHGDSTPPLLPEPTLLLYAK